MAESTTYSSMTDELGMLFISVGDGDLGAVGKLTEILRLAEPRECGDWDEDVRMYWENGLQDFAKKCDLKRLDGKQRELVSAMLNCCLEGTMFRNLYAILAKDEFPNYGDPAGLIQALGIRDEKEPLPQVNRRLAVMAHVKRDAFCFAPAFGVGVVRTVDDFSNEVKVTFQRRQTLGLRNFLDSMLLVKMDTEVHKWLLKTERPKKMPLSALNERIQGAVCSAFPPLMNPARALLVPHVMSDVQLRNLTAVAEAPEVSEAGPSSADSSPEQSWEQSRSLKELSERMKSVSSLEEGKEYEVDDLRAVLIAGARRDSEDIKRKEEEALNLALSLAELQQKLPASMSQWFSDVLADLVEKEADVWMDHQLFLDTSDKMPGRQVLPWFKVTCSAMGADYLVERTCYLPHRLWSNTEKALPASEAGLLPKGVAQALDNELLSADALLWIWKTKYGDLKDKYLTNPNLLFRTLQKGVKGTYLKAHRDLFKLMMDDEKFQKHLMRNGNEKSVSDFVHCIKRLPLLDASDRQSLVVKIVRLYPQYLYLVEEKKVVRAALPRVTSWRCLRLRQMQLQHLIDVMIPENARALADARSRGDLRENSEFKYAKEQQALLRKEQARYEQSLLGVQGTDFRDVVVEDEVVVGSQVTVKYVIGGEKATYCILGLLDTIPERRLVSFETEVAKILLNCKKGDLVEMPNGSEAEIVKIEALPEDLLEWLNGIPELGEDKASGVMAE